MFFVVLFNVKHNFDFGLIFSHYTLFFELTKFIFYRGGRADVTDVLWSEHSVRGGMADVNGHECGDLRERPNWASLR